MTVESLEHQVLSFLVDAGDEAVPGDMIAKKLGILGSDVHKAVEALRVRGYCVEVRGHAWRLTDYPERLGESELSVLLTTRELGRSLRHFEETGSTSEMAWAIGQEGGPHGLVVVADRQTKGKGRQGRSWASPGGCNLYFSVLLRPELPPARTPELTLVAAVALCEAIRETGCERARIKWPNDVEIGGKKAAGILTEASLDARGVDFAVVGMGVDVNMTLAEMPPEIRETATSLRLALGKPYPRARLLTRILDRLEMWLDRHEDEGFEPVRARWTALASTVGARVRVTLAGKLIEGRAEGIDGLGHLLVRTEPGHLERVVAGDVETLRAEG